METHTPKGHIHTQSDKDAYTLTLTVSKIHIAQLKIASTPLPRAPTLPRIAPAYSRCDIAPFESSLGLEAQ